MGTAIQIRMHLTLIMHDETTHRPFTFTDGEFIRAGIGQVAQSADIMS